MGLAFDGVSGSLTTTLTSHSTLRTFSIWGWITSSGEAGKGRFFDKGAGVNMEQLQIEGDDTPDTIAYIRGFSGTDVVAKYSIPALDTWHHFAVSFNAVAATSPVMYLNGVAQTLTTDTQGTGTADTNALAYIIGNRVDDRTFHGKLAEFAVWDAILDAAEIASLAKGFQAKLIRPASLVSYIDMVGYA
jgi:hypothetical protein